MDEDEDRSFLFEECKDRGHPDDHWTDDDDAKKFGRINPCQGARPVANERGAWERCSCPCHRSYHFVNAYEIDRCYGGPEEGGWWYDTGEPVSSWRFEKLRDAEAWAEKARADFPLTKSRYSVLGGEDYNIHIEGHFARAWPETRPHYE